MEASTATDRSVRLLGLGNEALADDAFGVRVAREVERRFHHAVDVAISSASGFHLLDHIIGARFLLVVDTVQTGSAPPGSIRVLREDQVRAMPGGSPHFRRLFDVLTAARKLGISVPADVVFLTVEACDCVTVGGRMHRDVERAIDAAVQAAGELLTRREMLRE